MITIVWLRVHGEKNKRHKIGRWDINYEINVNVSRHKEEKKDIKKKSATLPSDPKVER